jgi:CRP-like cAMP-binding protein
MASDVRKWCCCLSQRDDGSSVPVRELLCNDDDVYDRVPASLPSSFSHLSSHLSRSRLVRYGDITPQNDVEVAFSCIAILFVALVFGFLISQVGVVVASMDRQTSILEEKLEGIKEYVAWRELPKPLAIRVKKQFEYFFSHRSGFDEDELLEGLPTSLGTEVKRFVLKETIGKLPLFENSLDPEFQMEIFPYITPVAYPRGETLWRRGDASRDLAFLVAGQVVVLSHVTHQAISIITKDTETYLSQEGFALIEQPHNGCIGQEVILGLRRRATMVAPMWCESLVITKEDLIAIFRKHRRSGIQVCQILLGTIGKKQRLQTLAARFMIEGLPKHSSVRSALIIQLHWGRYALHRAIKEAPLGELLLNANSNMAASVNAARFNLLLDQLEALVLKRLATVREQLRGGHPKAAREPEPNANLAGDVPGPSSCALRAIRSPSQSLERPTGTRHLVTWTNQLAV